MQPITTKILALHISGMMNAIYVKNLTYCRDVPMERLYDSSHGYAMPQNSIFSLGQNLDKNRQPCVEIFIGHHRRSV